VAFPILNAPRSELPGPDKRAATHPELPIRHALRGESAAAEKLNPVRSELALQVPEHHESPALRSELSWTHYRLLLGVEDARARDWYLNGPTDPKIQFHETIKDIEQRLGDANVRLQSFIVSNTSSHTMTMLWNMEKSEMQKRHVLFQEEDRDSYVRSMLEAAGAGSGAR